MKLILNNIASNDVKAIKALITVATNLKATAKQYDPDPMRSRYYAGYNTVVSKYYDIEYEIRADFVPSANPFEPQSPEAKGYDDAVSDFSTTKILWVKCSTTRWRVEATGNTPASISQLMRFAHTLGKVYENIGVTIEE